MGTVLVVEDSPATRQIVMRLLQRRGYSVVGASNGVEALDVVHRARPDLVLLDVMMPEMDGFTFLAILRREPDTHNLPVIILSALSDEPRMNHARELGANDYLVKTRFSYDDLLDRVGRHLKH